VLFPKNLSDSDLHHKEKSEDSSDIEVLEQHGCASLNVGIRTMNAAASSATSSASLGTIHPSSNNQKGDMAPDLLNISISQPHNLQSIHATQEPTRYVHLQQLEGYFNDQVLHHDREQKSDQKKRKKDKEAEQSGAIHEPSAVI